MTEVPEVLFACVHNAGRDLDEVRPIVDEIDRRGRDLLAELVPGEAS